MYKITIKYLDDVICDGGCTYYAENSYNYSNYCDAVRAYYRELKSDEPRAVYADFRIKLMDRIKHDDIMFYFYTMDGARHNFNTLNEAKKARAKNIEALRGMSSLAKKYNTDIHVFAELAKFYKMSKLYYC